MEKFEVHSVTRLLILFLSIQACSAPDAHLDTSLMERAALLSRKPGNMFNPDYQLFYSDSVLGTFTERDGFQVFKLQKMRAIALLHLGKNTEAAQAFRELVAFKGIPEAEATEIEKLLALSYLRLGEQENCIDYHSPDACILPIRGGGIHLYEEGSAKACEQYIKILRNDSSDLESRWLLSIAAMTLNQYNDSTFAPLVIDGLSGQDKGEKTFYELAAELDIQTNNMAGGVVVEDFSGDGHLDIVCSGSGLEEKLAFFLNDGHGRFKNLSKSSGLEKHTGGLHLMQTDYDNDGLKDIFVVRGGWNQEYGALQPNLLLRNEGNGSFTDVTKKAGLLSFHPTQTATWNDFNLDGWLDVFVGNETSNLFNKHPCELFLNNGDGTFREVASIAGAACLGMVKGVNTGDFNSDGWPDLVVSTLDKGVLILKNNGLMDGEVSFQDVSKEIGLEHTRGTFSTWLHDMDNDGDDDLVACEYQFAGSLAFHFAKEHLLNESNAGFVLLYENDGTGHFANVTEKAGLAKCVFAMGSNYGDIDNDGLLDLYFGTGNPDLKSVVPNKMFKNMGANVYKDITLSSRTGHLQKGHGVSFADIDNDGDQDIYADMGGAYPGDAYPSVFFLNPGRSLNNWIVLDLEGVAANKPAIGARIKITITENGQKRSVYRTVSSGSSFGASPLRREIGLGTAESVESVEILWPGEAKPSYFTGLQLNTFYKIRQGSKAEVANIKKITWILKNPLCVPDGTL